MKKAQKSYRTKRQLADTLKQLLKKEPIEKIRIQHLTAPCGIHRQSFYYHFEDINDLLCWSAREDIAAWQPPEGDDVPWQQRLPILLLEIAENRNYHLAVLDSPACTDVRQHFHAVLTQLFRVSASRSGSTSVPDETHIAAQVSILSFVLDQWVRGGLELSPDELVRFVESQLPGAQDWTPPASGEVPNNARASGGPLTQQSRQTCSIC